jgi:hypothetical protein
MISSSRQATAEWRGESPAFGELRGAPDSSSCSTVRESRLMTAKCKIGRR